MFAPSIKDSERLCRAGEKDLRATFKITGPQIAIPPNFHNALRNGSFKESIVEFFIASWDNNDNALILGDKTVYATSKEFCFSFKCRDDKVIRLQEIGLTNYFDEADNMMFSTSIQYQHPLM